MELSEKSFQILDSLDRHEIVSQRQLAKHSGVSLAQVNYLLKRLLEKGLVKIKNFQKNPKKTPYLYLLTPAGMEAKYRVAARFLMSKLREYNHLREILLQKLTSIEKGSSLRIIFVGPPVVKDFVDSVIKERRLKFILVNHFSHWRDLKEIDPESFDIVLLLDGSSEGLKKISDNLNIPKNKLTVLW